MNRIDKGRLGEELVVRFLRGRGYIIVKQNFKTKFGEIDVIAENDTHMIFTEVKLRKEGAAVSGFEAVDRAKRKRLKSAAAYFLSKTSLPLQPRFDVAEITLIDLGREQRAELRYLEDAFR